MLIPARRQYFFVVRHSMKILLFIILIITLHFESYSQTSNLLPLRHSKLIIDADTSDLRKIKMSALIDARNEKKISDNWDLEQFATIDTKSLNKAMRRLTAILKKQNIRFQFLSYADYEQTKFGDDQHFLLSFDFPVNREQKS